MTRQQAIEAVCAAGEDAKRRDPMTGSIVDALVADIVQRLRQPATTHARTRWNAPHESPAWTRWDGVDRGES